MKYDLGGVVIDRCPLALLKHPWTQEAMKLYSAYKNGITPRGCGLNAETAHYSAVMNALAGLSAEAEQWYRKESEKRGSK